MSRKNKKPILVAGIPRSGTTWFSNVLASSGEYEYIHEPDNERHTYSAYIYKQTLPRFPFLLSKDSEPKYLKLFYRAFNHGYIDLFSFSNKVFFKLSGFNKQYVENGLKDNGVNKHGLFKDVMWMYRLLPKSVSGFPRIIKSVHCGLSLDFLLNQFDLSSVLIIRHPAAIVSSYLKMNNPDIDRGVYKNRRLMEYLFEDEFPDISDFESIEEFAGFQIAIFYRYFHKTLKENKDILLIEHEKLCMNPLKEYAVIFDKLGIDFNEKVKRFISDHNKEGEGYEIKRSSEQIVNKWRNILTKDQIERIKIGYNRIPPVYYTDFVL